MAGFDPHDPSLLSLSEAARDCLVEAVQEATRAGHEDVGVLHLLGVLLKREAVAPHHPLRNLSPAWVWKVACREARPSVGGRFPAADRELKLLLERCAWDHRSFTPRPAHYLLATLESGRPGELLALAQGLEPTQVAHGAEALTGEEALEVPEPTHEWRTLGWLFAEEASLGSRVFTQMGEDWREAAAWIEKESARAGPSEPGFHMRAVHHARRLAPFRVEPEDLLRHLGSCKSVGLAYWRLGQAGSAPQPDSFNPGVACAREWKHSSVEPLHVLWEGLQEPRFQSLFRSLLDSCREALEKLPRGGGEEPVLSSQASGVLKRTAGFCLRHRVEPCPIQAAYVAMCCEDEGVEAVLAGSGKAPGFLRMRLRRELLGRLGLGPWEVDGICLGTSGTELGELARQGDLWLNQGGTRLWLDEDFRVQSLCGRELTGAGERLLGAGDRAYRAEGVVGWRRLDRWLPCRGLELKVGTEQGEVASVSLWAAGQRL